MILNINTNLQVLTVWFKIFKITKFLETIWLLSCEEQHFPILEFCHSYESIVSTPVVPLHCVIHCVSLGLFIWLLQGFNWLRCDNMSIPESSNCEAHSIFTGVYKDSVQSYWRILALCYDNNVTQTCLILFPIWILCDAHDDDDNSTEKKWPMKWVVYSLVILLFMLSDKHRKYCKGLEMRCYHSSCIYLNEKYLNVGLIVIIFQEKN